MPQVIYNSHYGNGAPAMFTSLYYVSKAERQKDMYVIIAENPIAVMGLYVDHSEQCAL